MIPINSFLIKADKIPILKYLEKFLKRGFLCPQSAVSLAATFKTQSGILDDQTIRFFSQQR